MPMENITDVRSWLQSTDYKGGVGLTVKLFIKKESVDAFKELMKEHIKQTFTEKGVLHFKCNLDYEDDTVFW